MASSQRLTAALGLLAVTALCAQDAAPVSPPAAQVLGPRSPLETYDAPVAKPAPAPVIDFPKLIAEPGANDGLEITPSLRRLTLDFGTPAAAADPALVEGFLTFSSQSKIPAARRGALQAAIAAKLAVYRELPFTLGDARFIQQDITEAYQAAGYPLLAVVVPPQEIVDGALLVRVNEFSLAGYQATYSDGQGGYSPDAPHRTSDKRLAALLDPLLAAPVLDQRDLDRKVKFLNASPYRQARVVFEPGKQLGESVAQIQIDEKRPWSVQAGYNNHATESSGTNRYSLGGGTGYLPFENHQLSWNATIGDRINEFENYSLIYTAPNQFGHTLTANVNYSDTASSSIPGVGSASTTLQSSLAYDIPLLATETFNWTLNTTGFLKQFERDSLFGGVSVGGARFDSVQLVVNQVFDLKESTATNQFTAGVVVSFADVTARNTDEDFREFYNSATGEAATRHYLLNYARVQQLAPLWASLDGWSAETQLSWQITNQQLAGSDNFAIGGPQAMRAYQSSEVAGDEGFYAIQFLHLKPFASESLGVAGKWIQQVSPSLFIEGGEGQFRNGTSDSLWDYGVQAGLAAKPGLNVTASLAVAGRDGALTEQGDVRFFISTQLRY